MPKLGLRSKKDVFYDTWAEKRVFYDTFETSACRGWAEAKKSTYFNIPSDTLHAKTGFKITKKRILQ